MILDGYWKLDLLRFKHKLRFWSWIGSTHEGFAEHKVNQCLLYSAAVIRKIVEDERDADNSIRKAKMTLPPLPLLKTTVPIKRYRHTGEDKMFANSKVFLNDYDLCNEQSDSLPLAQICNQIIHSYSWAIIHEGKRRIYGVLLASDKEKEKDIFLLSIADWAAAIQEVLNTSNI